MFAEASSELSVSEVCGEAAGEPGAWLGTGSAALGAEVSPTSVGRCVVGRAVGTAEGRRVGRRVGRLVGTRVGRGEGWGEVGWGEVGWGVGWAVGLVDVGSRVVGSGLGREVGWAEVGLELGWAEVGLELGWADVGLDVGPAVIGSAGASVSPGLAGLGVTGCKVGPVVEGAGEEKVGTDVCRTGRKVGAGVAVGRKVGLRDVGLEDVGRGDVGFGVGFGVGLPVDVQGRMKPHGRGCAWAKKGASRKKSRNASSRGDDGPAVRIGRLGRSGGAGAGRKPASFNNGGILVLLSNAMGGGGRQAGMKRGTEWGRCNGSRPPTWTSSQEQRWLEEGGACESFFRSGLRRWFAAGRSDWRGPRK
jgi:hypothetical protein